MIWIKYSIKDLDKINVSTCNPQKHSILLKMEDLKKEIELKKSELSPLIYLLILMSSIARKTNAATKELEYYKGMIKKINNQIEEMGKGTRRNNYNTVMENLETQLSSYRNDYEKLLKKYKNKPSNYLKKPYGGGKSRKNKRTKRRHSS